MKAKIKMVVDIVMLILFLMQMAYHLIGDPLHEWMGIMLFVFVILHNILNRKYYLRLCKGKCTPMRFFYTAINLMLIISFLCVAASAVFLSATVSSIFHLRAVLLGRKMHMVFTTWSFILMSAHLGLHWNRGIHVIKKQPKELQFLCCISMMLASGYGLYAFISRELLQRMLFLSGYVFFDYEESVFLFIVDYIAILCLFSGITYGMKRFIAKQK